MTNMDWRLSRPAFCGYVDGRWIDRPATGIWFGEHTFTRERGWDHTHEPASLAVRPPSPDRPTVDQVMPIVWIYRCIPGNGVGGSLHIFLDDDNIEDRNLAFCRETAAKKGDVCGVALATLCEGLSYTQRKKVAHRSYDETFWEMPPKILAPEGHPRWFIEDRATTEDFWSAFHGEEPSARQQQPDADGGAPTEPERQQER